MKEMTYPSISGPNYSVLGQPCVAFEKFDGSNLRFFWDRKRGWHRTGTRFKWFKPATPTFGVAATMFQEQFAEGILDVIRRTKDYRNVSSLVAFCEFFGPKTFSGLHADGDDRELVLFDVHTDQTGFVPPKDFVAHFGHLRTAPVVYEGEFTREFMADVRVGKFPVSEGVVAKGRRVKRQRKGKTEYEVWMAKVKTQAWLDELRARSGDSEDFRQEYDRNVEEQDLPERDE